MDKVENASFYGTHVEPYQHEPEYNDEEMAVRDGRQEPLRRKLLSLKKIVPQVLPAWHGPLTTHKTQKLSN